MKKQNKLRQTKPRRTVATSPRRFKKPTRIITINGKMTVWKCKQIFPTNTLMQNIEITDFKPRLAAENTSVLIILVTTVYI